MNGSDLMEATSIFMDLTGEAYWYIVKDKKVGRSLELWPIPSQYMRAIPGETTKEFIKGWEYRRGNKAVELEPGEVIDFRTVNPHNFLQGFSAVRAVADTVYIQNKMYEFEQALFENKARTGSLIESSADVSQPEMERLREDWKQRYAGTQKTGTTAILPPGLKVVKDQMTPEELSYIEGRKITREEIAAALDCPISLWDKTAIRANVEAALYFHAKFGILPRLRKIEEKLNERIDDLYPAKERGNAGVLFWAFDNPVPSDAEFDQKARRENVDSGIISRDEAREEIGKDARGGPADELFIDFNKVPIGQRPEQAEEAMAVRILEKVKERLG
jgi:HK97 family phage portal protein